MRLYCILLYVFILSGLHAQQAENREYRKNQTFIGNDSDIMVVSHRADWRNAPENSLQGIQNCIDMGVDMVEIDLKKTKDGHLVLIHDRTVDRSYNEWKRESGRLYLGGIESNAVEKWGRL